MKFTETDHFPDGKRLFSPELVEETLSDRLWGSLVGFHWGPAGLWVIWGHWVTDSATVLLGVLIPAKLSPAAHSFTDSPGWCLQRQSWSVFMEDREPAPWDKDLDSMNYGPPHHLGVAQTVELTPTPLWYLILKRTNPLYNVLFHKTGVRPWPGSPLNTIPGEEALSALNSWLKDEFIFSIGLRKGRGYFTNSKCFLW